MEPEIRIISRASDLPEDWDRASEDYFQTREFLSHTEKYNPCRQRYYLLYKQGIFITGVAAYTLRLDLLTYLNIPSPIRMNIAGIPCSVSSGGIVGSSEFLPQIIGFMQAREKGLLLFLNLTSEISASSIIPGKTLPTILFRNHFISWEVYLDALKSGYRRRIRLLSAPFSEVRREQLPCAGFDGRMYKLYIEVLRRSKGKLETLSQEFFRNLPPTFELTAFYYSETLIGWYMTILYRERFYFFLGGIDYQANRKYNTYFNILLNVVRDGIGKGASVIDLGQTAEIPKLRLGGEVFEKFLGGYHSNRLLRAILKAGKGLLEYSTVLQETHVFKEVR